MEVALFPSGEAKTLERSVKRRKSSGGLRGRGRGRENSSGRVHPNNCACPRRGIIHSEASRFDRFVSSPPSRISIPTMEILSSVEVTILGKIPRSLSLGFAILVYVIYIYIFLGLDWS